MSEKRKVAELFVHPFNLEIYGEPDDGLADSLAQFGLQHPISVTPDGAILSGARRWTAAKANAWDEVDCIVVDHDTDADLKKYVLVANAYRHAKTTYTQKKEADAYLALLDAGDYTRDQLRSIAADKRGTMALGHGGSDQNRKNYNEYPAALAAQAAGMDPATYSRFRYVDDGGAAKAVEKSVAAGLISRDQGGTLKGQLANDIGKMRRGELDAKPAYQNARRRLHEAERDHSMTAAQRHAREAEDAAVEVIKRGRSWVDAVRAVFRDHGRALGPETAMSIVGTITEAQAAIRAGIEANGINLALPESSEEIEDVEAVVIA